MHINSKNGLNHFRKHKTLETLWKNLNLQVYEKNNDFKSILGIGWWFLNGMKNVYKTRA